MMVCESGDEGPRLPWTPNGRHRTLRADHEATPGDQYTHQVRDGYTWGPDGAIDHGEGRPTPSW